MLIDVLLAAIAAVFSGLLVAFLVGPLRRWLIAAAIYDAPNARSSHAEVKPRGGGLAILVVILPVWGGASWVFGLPDQLTIIAALTAFLGVVCFLDDVRDLPPAVRLASHVVAVVVGLWTFDAGPLFQGLLPGWLDTLAMGFLWLWFVNLYNFMDGIDGITGVETVAVGVGLGVVALLSGGGALGAVLPWLLAGAAAGFLWWNWSPAKIFLGDVGSVPLGFMLGWLLLQSAAAGQWAAALILPGYYLADATITLLRRLARREKVWRAHRSHAYQRAVQVGWSHAAVAARIATANVVLIGCAILAVFTHPLLALAASGIVIALLWHMLVGRRPASA